MTASLLNGRLLADQILSKLKTAVDHRIASGLIPPGLAVILIGDDEASHIYVNHKQKACKQVGFYTERHHLPAETSENKLIELIQALNEQSHIHGILVQLPLPKQINTQRIIETIHPSKDVDGFHPYNFGRLAQGNPLLRPCTPYGIIQLLKHYQINIHGKHAIVIGTSKIVGRPMALELLLEKATVTMCHRATKNLEEHVKQCDLLVIAAGSQDIIPSHYFHEKQIIVDVGMHRQSDGRLRGDIDFDVVKEKVAWITPVPGGVGPMTICTLLENTLKAAS